MKNLTKVAIASSAILLASSGSLLAGDMRLDLGTNSYDLGKSAATAGSIDANTVTGTFNEFGFNQLLATSIYDFSDNTVLGSFFDTNIPSVLNAYGVPTSGTALDGFTPVSLVMPNCTPQCDLDALSPIAPPLNEDNEGFLQSWDLQVEYNFAGTLTLGGPIYTGGTFSIFFNDLLNDANDRLVIGGSLTGSTINAANLDLFFDVTFAESGFLQVDNGGGFVDAAAAILANPGSVTLALDTNVNPPVPTADQLLLVVSENGTHAIRQATLDGSITADIPTPGTIALLGLGLVGFGVAARRNKAS